MNTDPDFDTDVERARKEGFQEGWKAACHALEKLDWSQEMGWPLVLIAVETIEPLAGSDR